METAPAPAYQFDMPPATAPAPSAAVVPAPVPPAPPASPEDAEAQQTKDILNKLKMPDGQKQQLTKTMDHIADMQKQAAKDTAEVASKKNVDANQESTLKAFGEFAKTGASAVDMTQKGAMSGSAGALLGASLQSAATAPDPANLPGATPALEGNDKAVSAMQEAIAGAQAKPGGAAALGAAAPQATEAALNNALASMGGPAASGALSSLTQSLKTSGDPTLAGLGGKVAGMAEGGAAGAAGAAGAGAARFAGAAAGAAAGASQFGLPGKLEGMAEQAMALLSGAGSAGASVGIPEGAGLQYLQDKMKAAAQAQQK